MGDVMTARELGAASRAAVGRKDKEGWLGSVESRQSQELFQAFIRQLTAQAKVEIVRPDMLD